MSKVLQTGSIKFTVTGLATRPVEIAQRRGAISFFVV